MTDNEAKAIGIAAAFPQGKETVTLHLPGCTPCEAIVCWNIDDVAEALKFGWTCGAAGSMGAMNIWKVEGGYRCEHYIICRTVDSQVLPTIPKVLKWVKPVLKAIDL